MLYVRENKRLREEVEGELQNALKDFMLARAVSSDAVIEEAIALPGTKIKLDVSSQNVMSVEVPVFNITGGDVQELYPYSFASVTGELDSAVASLSTLLPKLLKLAEVEKLRQKRRQRSYRAVKLACDLEYVMIPQFEETIKYITMKLDENERGATTRLMKVKSMLQTQNEV